MKAGLRGTSGGRRHIVGLSEISRRLAAGETSSVILVEKALAQAAATKHVFISLRREEALNEARVSDDRRSNGHSLGPLDGIPIAVKDVIDMKGLRTTAGSCTRLTVAPALRDAAVVAAVKRQGLIAIGKTNLSEFAFSGLGLNPSFGTPTASYIKGEARAPGGSSSGSAIAVERDVVSAAIGTDTAGSIRVPSAFNGLVGFRASTNRYLMSGVHPLAATFDTLGPIARSVSDCAWMDLAMRDRGRLTLTPPSMTKVRLIVDAAMLEDGDVEPAVRDNLMHMMESLAIRGAKVNYKSVGVVSEARKVISDLGWLGAYEAWQWLGDIVNGHSGALVDRRVSARLRAASLMSEQQAEKIITARRDLMASLSMALDGALLVLPTVKHVAPKLKELEADDDYFAALNLQTLSITMIGSLLDMPGLALPSGYDDEGLATSVLISATQGKDDALLASGLAIEHALVNSWGE